MDLNAGEDSISFSGVVNMGGRAGPWRLAMLRKDYDAY